MFNVGFAELLAILALALIVLGPAKLPDAVRTAGRVMGEVRRISGDFQQQLRTALEDQQVDEEPEPRRDSPPVQSSADREEAAGELPEVVHRSVDSVEASGAAEVA